MYLESVFTGDVNISLDEFSPAAQSLLKTIVNEEAKKGNNSIKKKKLNTVILYLLYK